MLPIEALVEIKPKLRSDDVEILEFLATNGANSTQCSFSKDAIQTEVNLTSARTSNALIRLEVACLVERQAYQKPQKFYITDSGMEMLTLFG